jgi:AAA domain/Primase C terminal 1 (PriCT-1)
MAFDLEELQAQLPPEPEATPPEKAEIASARKAFLPCFEKVFSEGVPEGARNQTLFRTAVMLLREGYNSLSFPLLIEANAKCSPPLAESELKTLFESASKESNGQARYKSFGCEDVMASLCSNDCPLLVKQAKKETASARAWELNQFLANDFHEPPPYCDALLYPKGLTVLGGEPKSGKTLFLLNFALALANGKPFLTFEVGQPCRVLIIQAELSEGRLQERMASLSKSWATPENKLYLATIRGAFLNEPDGFEAVRKIIDEVSPDVIAIDPLTEFFSGDENKQQEMRLLTTRLTELTDGNRSVIISHHLRKGAEGGSPDFNSLRGSGVLMGRVDTAILIAPDLNGQLIVDFKTRNCVRPAKIIAGYDEALALKFIKEAGARKVTDEAVLELMKATPETTIKDLSERICEACDCKPGTARKHITGAIKAGKLKKEGTTTDAIITLP